MKPVFWSCACGEEGVVEVPEINGDLMVAATFADHNEKSRDCEREPYIHHSTKPEGR